MKRLIISILVIVPCFGAITYINLSTQVKNILAVANGGTGLSASGTNGNCLVSNGSIWTSIACPSVSGSTYTIASGTVSLGTSAIASASCATTVSAAATGVTITDNILADFYGDPTGVTGYQAGSMLTIVKWPTANFVNFKVCNNTPNSLTPVGVTLDWRVIR